MNYAEQQEMIILQFKKSAKGFCDEISALGCDVVPTFKGDEKPENLDCIFAEIYCKSYIIIFRYSAHAILGSQHSILDCMIRFGKAATERSIPLPFVYDFCDENIVEPFCIPCISNGQGMKEAFSLLGDAVKKLIPHISSISYDEVQKQEIEQYYMEEYSLFMGKPEIDAKMEDLFLRFTASKFSSSVYILALKGKMEKAIKKLQKDKQKFRCEKRLLSLWQAGKCMDRGRIPSIVSNMEWLNDSGMSGVDGKELVPIIFSWFVLTIPVSIIYLGIYFLLNFIQGQNSVLLTGVTANFPFCIFAGFLTSINISYFTRFWFIRLLYRKNCEKLIEQDQMNNSRRLDRVMKFLTRLVIVCGVIFTVFISTWNLNFKSDGFIDNTAFFSIKGEYYAYDEIESVSYVPNRVNGYGETLEFPSYKLVLKNGNNIDLYEYADISDYDPDLIEFLKSKGIEVIRGGATSGGATSGGATSGDATSDGATSDGATSTSSAQNALSNNETSYYRMPEYEEGEFNLTVYSDENIDEYEELDGLDKDKKIVLVADKNKKWKEKHSFRLVSDTDDIQIKVEQFKKDAALGVPILEQVGYTYKLDGAKKKMVELVEFPSYVDSYFSVVVAYNKNCVAYIPLVAEDDPAGEAFERKMIEDGVYEYPAHDKADSNFLRGAAAPEKYEGLKKLVAVYGGMKMKKGVKGKTLYRKHFWDTMATAISDTCRKVMDADDDGYFRLTDGRVNLYATTLFPKSRGDNSWPSGGKALANAHMKYVLDLYEPMMVKMRAGILKKVQIVSWEQTEKGYIKARVAKVKSAAGATGATSSTGAAGATGAADTTDVYLKKSTLGMEQNPFGWVIAG